MTSCWSRLFKSVKSWCGFHTTGRFLQCLNLLNWHQFQVKVQNDFSDEMFSSKWHYAKSIVKREKVSGTTTGYRNYDFHETDDRSRVRGSCRKARNNIIVIKDFQFFFVVAVSDAQAFGIEERRWGRSVPKQLSSVHPIIWRAVEGAGQTPSGLRLRRLQEAVGKLWDALCVWGKPGGDVQGGRQDWWRNRNLHEWGFLQTSSTLYLRRQTSAFHCLDFKTSQN